MKVYLKDSIGQIRRVKVGFSWTTLFFGFLVPIFRGDVKWTIIMFCASVLTLGLAQLVMAFTYNRTYIRDLLEKGYFPADDFSRSILEEKKFLETSRNVPR
jgi:hypothetical protein